MTTENQAGTVKKLVIKVIGMGGAGISAVEQMARMDLMGLEYLVVHSNSRELESSSIATKLLLGVKRTRGLGCGGDPDLGKAAAEDEFDQLKTLCDWTDLVVIVCGLGGGTATGAAPVLARAARETGALVLGLVTLPFEFEGNRRQRQAQAGFQLLKAAADGVVCLPLPRAVKVIDENTSLQETFALTNEMLAQAVKGISQMLTRPGLINVDFADLCSVLRGRHAESYCASAQAKGEGRSREVVEKLKANPLLEEGHALADADALLVNLVGGPDLTMADVNRIMEQINRQAENAHLILGAATDPALIGCIQLTVIASRHCAKAAAQTEPEPDEPTGSEQSDLTAQLLGAGQSSRPASRFVAPPPALPPEKLRQIWEQQGGPTGRRRKVSSKWKQGQLPLEIVSKGRFEKSEPTIHEGEDLDVPTYIRRGIALN